MTMISCGVLFLLTVFSIIVPKEKAILISCIPIICLIATCAHIIDIRAIIAIYVFCIIAFIHFNVTFRNKIPFYFFLITFIIMTYYFITHKIQGFNNPLIIDNVRASRTFSYFSMDINFDKVIYALLLLNKQAHKIKSIYFYDSAKTNGKSIVGMHIIYNGSSCMFRVCEI